MVTHGSANGAAADPAPLKVLIAGAGIGGLAAAVSLRQSGHDVTLLESSSFSGEIGAGLHIAPYCMGALKRLGVDLLNDKTIGGVENTGTSIWPPGAPKPMYMSYAEDCKRWQHRRVMVHRAHLHRALRDRALSPEGPGKPCVLRLSSRVASVDADKGEVTLVSGEKVYGDLVVGADGVHSKCRNALPSGHGYVPFHCGLSTFRFTIPIETLRNDPVTAQTLGPDGTLVATVTLSQIKRLVMYPIAGGTLANFVFLHDARESETTDQSPANLKKLVVKVGSEFNASFRAVLDKVSEDTIRLWPLLDMPALGTWINGKMALLGDAAHPHMPHRASGASQAIEDGVSLGTLFCAGTPASAVAERLALYEECRKERASKTQEASRIFSQTQEYQKRKGFNATEFDAYNFGHDEYDHSLKALRQHLLAKNTKTRLRAPLSFGAAPGPSQPGNIINNVLGSKPSDFNVQQTVHTIRFNTSKTYLQNFFPSPAFAFPKHDTMIQASLVCTSYRGLPWLGGHGYERIGLQIHGVHYTKENGDVIKGTFVPVYFENLPDSAVAGREERGAPVVGCDIDVTNYANGKDITLSWKGTQLGQIRLHGLSQPAVPSAPAPKVDDDGLLTYRYIPSVGNPGKADVEYAIFEPYEEEPKPKTNGVVSGAPKPMVGMLARPAPPKEYTPVKATPYSTQHATQASFQFVAGQWQSLPTLHHIVQDLEGIPNYGILEARMDVVQGGSDGSNLARRIE
ncbi:FAD/NAD(P)-binding domain-containing protein [Thozetella sp. PMI_491]|nr:FAD/NAD(P)-binding domain-containing protein [Thozetella sp. PMI_491]